MVSYAEVERAVAAHGGRDVSVDTVFELLSNRRRRTLLAVLARHGYSLTLADLADEVAAREHDAPVSDVPEEDVLVIYLTLYHQHVPKLESADVVRYEQDRDLVARGENAPVVERVLDVEPAV